MSYCASRDLTQSRGLSEKIKCQYNSPFLEVFCSVATTTHIFDGGILIDLALQVLENALSEKSVCGHDGLKILLWIVLLWVGVVGVLKMKLKSQAESSTDVGFEFAR